MKSALLPKERIVPLLKCIGQKMEVIAPVMQDGEPVFTTWRGQDLALDSENPLVPPTEFLLPQRDLLFRYNISKERLTLEEEPIRPRFIFGIKPCDMKAIEILDKVFSTEPLDEIYSKRRRATIIAAESCIRPGDECFCSVLGSGPECNCGYDLLFTLVEDPETSLQGSIQEATGSNHAFLVEAATAAGESIIEECEILFEEARPQHFEEKRKRLIAASEKILDRTGKRSPQQISAAIENAPWEEIGRQCLRCGGCTFVCPTCHCFNIEDMGLPEGERRRCRDSCLLSGFCRMTSGADPRPTQGDRIRHWYLHKFKYMPERIGTIGCVGCGRCNRICLAEIDRWKFLEGASS